MPHTSEFEDADFEQSTDENPRKPKPRVVEVMPDDETQTLAVRAERMGGVSAAEDAAQRIADKMKLQWEAERAEREKWKAEDRWERFHERVCAMMASGIIAEGAAGVRPRASALADMALEYADCIVGKLRERETKLKAAREAAEARLVAEREKVEAARKAAASDT
jgi:hypothetical protein